MSISWDDILSAVASSCNVTIVCSDGIIESHKIIVATASDFLKRLMIDIDISGEDTMIMLPEFHKDQANSWFSLESLQSVHKDYFIESLKTKEVKQELLEVKEEPENLEQKCDIPHLYENEDYCETSDSQDDFNTLGVISSAALNPIFNVSKLRPILPKLHSDLALNEKKSYPIKPKVKELNKEKIKLKISLLKVNRTQDEFIGIDEEERSLEKLVKNGQKSLPSQIFNEGVPTSQELRRNDGKIIRVLQGTSFFNCSGTTTCRKRCVLCEKDAQRMKLEQNLSSKEYKVLYDSLKKGQTCCTSCGRNCCNQCGEIICKECKMLLRTLQRIEET